MDTEKMLIGYARVSSDGQDLRSQVGPLREAGCEKVFSEKASGVKMARPELDTAIDYCRPGDVLVVWKLDRLGRDMRGLVQLSARLDEKGVGLRSLTDNVDTSGPAGKFFFNIMASVAEMERGLMRERTHAGLKVARASGKAPGAPSKISESKRKLGLMMFDKGSSVLEVADALGCAPVTIYRWFTVAERKQPRGVGGRPPKSKQLELGMSA